MYLTIIDHLGEGLIHMLQWYTRRNRSPEMWRKRRPNSCPEWWMMWWYCLYRGYMLCPTSLMNDCGGKVSCMRLRWWKVSWLAVSSMNCRNKWCPYYILLLSMMIITCFNIYYFFRVQTIWRFNMSRRVSVKIWSKMSHKMQVSIFSLYYSDIILCLILKLK